MLKKDKITNACMYNKERSFFPIVKFSSVNDVGPIGYLYMVVVILSFLL